MAENAAKMSAEASTNLQKTLQEAPKAFQKAPNLTPRSFQNHLFLSQCKITSRYSQFAPHNIHSWLYEAFKTLFSTPIQNSQIIIRS